MEVAIPLIALGSMYVMSSQNKNKNKNNGNSYSRSTEGYTNMTQTQNALPGISPPTPVDNYPITAPVTTTNNASAYINPNQYSDKYYNPDNYAKNEKQAPSNYGVGGGLQTSYSLNGEPIDKQKFTHNNMMPYFGGKVRGASTDNNISEIRLDNMQGSGSQFFSKREQGPMFKPQQGYQYADGAPNMSDFYQSRVNPSLRMANVKPWEEQRVAPGLNKGYTTNGSIGYNSGMEAREFWVDRTVDELRVATNPKTTFELRGHEGPGTYYIKDAPTVSSQGKVEKHLPEKYFASGPERWLTTTGLEKAQTARGVELLHDVNRTDTTSEYYGSRASQVDGNYVNGEYQESKRAILPTKDYAPPHLVGTGSPTTGDYGIQSYSNLHNNRSTTRPDAIIGHASSLIKAVVSPVMDLFRPTRKEDVVDNMRFSGNPSTTVTNGQIYNPADRTRTTIREMTEAELDCNHLNVQVSDANAYLVTQHQPIAQQRDTTNLEHTGVAGPNGFTSAKSYEAEYRQHNNVNKTYESRPNPGGVPIFNQIENITIQKRDFDRNNNRMWVPSSGNTAGVTMRAIPDNLDRVKVSQGYNQDSINTDRISPDILNAFKSNPYTQSLESWVLH